MLLAVISGGRLSVLVFLALIAAAFAMRKFVKPKGDDKDAKPHSASLPAPDKATAAHPDEGELIAVLTAAVAASLNMSTYNLKIKAYRQIPQAPPEWNMAGRLENIGG